MEVPMKYKTITLVFLIFLVLSSSLSCARNTTREQSADASVLTTAAESATVVTTVTTVATVATLAEPSSSAVTCLYFEAIKEVYSEDSGLNGGISIISLDLTGAKNLSAEEKETLRYLVSSEYSFETYTYTYEQLVDQGLIDDKNLYFEKGILFEITDEPISGNAFAFKISKWRSGLGAIFYTDCTAKKTGDIWEYSLGGFAIS